MTYATRAAAEEAAEEAKQLLADCDADGSYSDVRIVVVKT